MPGMEGRYILMPSGLTAAIAMSNAIEGRSAMGSAGAVERVKAFGLSERASLASKQVPDRRLRGKSLRGSTACVARRAGAESRAGLLPIRFPIRILGSN